MIKELDEKEYLTILNLGKLIKDDFSLSQIGVNDKVLVYESNNKIVAFLVYSQMYEIIDILYIAVQEDLRRQGIARSLIEYLTKLPGAEKLMLEVRESNTGALAFYKSCGFKLCRTIKNYYGRENALSLERMI